MRCCAGRIFKTYEKDEDIWLIGVMESSTHANQCTMESSIQMQHSVSIISWYHLSQGMLQPHWRSTTTNNARPLSRRLCDNVQIAYTLSLSLTRSNTHTTASTHELQLRRQACYGKRRRWDQEHSITLAQDNVTDKVRFWRLYLALWFHIVGGQSISKALEQCSLPRLV